MLQNVQGVFPLIQGYQGLGCGYHRVNSLHIPVFCCQFHFTLGQYTPHFDAPACHIALRGGAAATGKVRVPQVVANLWPCTLQFTRAETLRSGFEVAPKTLPSSRSNVQSLNLLEPTWIACSAPTPKPTAAQPCYHSHTALVKLLHSYLSLLPFCSTKRVGEMFLTIIIISTSIIIIGIVIVIINSYYNYYLLSIGRCNKPPVRCNIAHGNRKLLSLIARILITLLFSLWLDQICNGIPLGCCSTSAHSTMTLC